VNCITPSGAFLVRLFCSACAGSPNVSTTGDPRPVSNKFGTTMICAPNLAHIRFKAIPRFAGAKAGFGSAPKAAPKTQLAPGHDQNKSCLGQTSCKAAFAQSNCRKIHGNSNPASATASNMTVARDEIRFPSAPLWAPLPKSKVKGQVQLFPSFFTPSFSLLSPDCVAHWACQHQKSDAAVASPDQGD
jgi:hypothetical protein